jgi:hypothetical protein
VVDVSSRSLRVATHFDPDASIHDFPQPPPRPLDRPSARAGAEGQLEMGAAPGAQRVFDDRLGGVGSERDDSLENTRPRRPGDADSGEYVTRPFRRRTRVFEHRTDEVAVRAHLGQDSVRNSEAELLLDPDPDVGEVERVGGELVGQRDVGREVVDVDTETVRDEAGEASGEIAAGGGSVASGSVDKGSADAAGRASRGSTGGGSAAHV